MKRIVARDRRTAGRADGYLSFTLRWPSGEYRQHSCGYMRLDSMIRTFRESLGMVPPGELTEATAVFHATIRKAGGGRGRIDLVSWSGSEPIEAFFSSVRKLWESFPKEDDDQRREVAMDDSEAQQFIQALTKPGCPR